MRLLTAGFCVLLCLLPATSVASAQTSASTEWVTLLLDRYARGDYAAFITPTTPLDLRRLRDALSREAEAWSRRGGAENVRRRQLVAATVALEGARSGLEIDWGEGKALIEWGSSFARKGPPDDRERLWHLAALAVIQGAFDNELLVGQQKLAWPRFEDEARFLLALVVMLEGETWPEPDRGDPWEEDEQALEDAYRLNAARRSNRQAPLPDVLDKASEYDRRNKMRKAIELLEDLSNASEIRAEALLRLGFLHLRLRHWEVAVDQFDEVLTLTKDPFLLFLAHFLTGMAREHDGDRANAIASYRAALELKPRAQSASFALGSLLFLGGERDQAAKLINAGTLPPAADDPWRTYQAGDFRFWNERLEALRRELR